MRHRPGATFLTLTTVASFTLAAAATLAFQAPAHARNATLYTTHSADFGDTPTPITPYPGTQTTGLSADLAGRQYVATAANVSIRTGCLELGRDIAAKHGAFVDWSYLDLRALDVAHVTGATLTITDCDTNQVIAVHPIDVAAAAGDCSSAPHCGASTALDACVASALVDAGGLPITAPRIDVRLDVAQDADFATAPFKWKGWVVAGRWTGQTSLDFLTPAAPITLGPADYSGQFAVSWQLAVSDEPLYYPVVDIDFDAINDLSDGAFDRSGTNADAEHVYDGTYTVGPAVKYVAGSNTTVQQLDTGTPGYLPAASGRGRLRWTFADLGVATSGRLPVGSVQNALQLVLDSYYYQTVAGRDLTIPLTLTHGRPACDGSGLVNTMGPVAAESQTITTAGDPDYAGFGANAGPQIFSDSTTDYTHYHYQVAPTVLEDLRMEAHVVGAATCVSEITLTSLVDTGGNPLPLMTFLSTDALHGTAVALVKRSTNAFIPHYRIVTKPDCNESFAIAFDESGHNDTHQQNYAWHGTDTFHIVDPGVCRIAATYQYGTSATYGETESVHQSNAFAPFGSPRNDGGFLYPNELWHYQWQDYGFDIDPAHPVDLTFFRLDLTTNRFAGWWSWADHGRMFKSCDADRPDPDDDAAFDAAWLYAHWSDPTATPSPKWHPVASDAFDQPLSGAAAIDDPHAQVDPLAANGATCAVLLVRKDDIGRSGDSALYFRNCDATAGCPSPSPTPPAAVPVHGGMHVFGWTDGVGSSCDAQSQPVGVQYRAGVGSYPYESIAGQNAGGVVNPGDQATFVMWPGDTAYGSAPVEGGWYGIDLHTVAGYLDLDGLTYGIEKTGWDLYPSAACTPALYTAAANIRRPDADACAADPVSANDACWFRIQFTGPCTIQRGTVPDTADMWVNGIQVKLGLLPAVEPGQKLELCGEPRRAGDTSAYGADNDLEKLFAYDIAHYHPCASVRVQGTVGVLVHGTAPTAAGNAVTYVAENAVTNLPSGLANPGVWAALTLPGTTACAGASAPSTAGRAVIDGPAGDWTLEASTNATCATHGNDTSVTWTALPGVRALSSGDPVEAVLIAAGYGFISDAPVGTAAPGARCVRAHLAAGSAAHILPGDRVRVGLEVAVADEAVQGEQICLRAIGGSDLPSGAVAPESEPVITVVDDVPIAAVEKSVRAGSDRSGVAGAATWVLRYANTSAVRGVDVPLVDCLPAGLVYDGIDAALTTTAEITLPPTVTPADPACDGGTSIAFVIPELDASILDPSEVDAFDPGTNVGQVALKTHPLAPGGDVENCATITTGTGETARPSTDCATSRTSALVITKSPALRHIGRGDAFSYDLAIDLSAEADGERFVRVDDPLPAGVLIDPVGGVAAIALDGSPLSPGAYAIQSLAPLRVDVLVPLAPGSELTLTLHAHLAPAAAPGSYANRALGTACADADGLATGEGCDLPVLSNEALVVYAPEVCDGLDNDGDGVTDDVDFDQDGAADDKPGDHCGAEGGCNVIACRDDQGWECLQRACSDDTCDGVDDDGDGMTDDEYIAAHCAPATTFVTVTDGTRQGTVACTIPVPGEPPVCATEAGSDTLHVDWSSPGVCGK